MDLDRVRAAPGVVAVVTAQDVPGENDVGPVFPGDPLFADGMVEYAGQALFAVAAATVEQARRAARLAEVEYRELEAILTIEDALAKEATVVPSHEMRRGEPERALAEAPHRLPGGSGWAARTISISRARSPSPSRARTATCWCGARPSTRARCST